MSRPQKVHPPIKMDFNSVLESVAGGSGIPCPPSKFVVTGLDYKTAQGVKTDAPSGIAVEITKQMTRGADSGSVLVVILTVFSPIPINVASNWIYDKIKDHRASKISHRGKEIEVSQDAIRRGIEEDFDVGRND